MLSVSSKKIVKRILWFLLAILGIIIIFKVVSMGIVTFVAKEYSSQFVSVGRDVDIIKVNDSSVNCNYSMVESNGERTFISSDNVIYEWISDDELVEIKKLDSYVKAMGVTEKYLILTIHNGGTYRIDIDSWVETELLLDKSVDNVIVAGDDYFLVQSGEYIDDDYRSHRNLYMFTGEDTKGVEIPLGESFKMSNEKFFGYDEVIECERGEYTIYSGDNRYIAIKKDNEIYSLVDDAQFLVGGNIVSFGDKGYVYGGKKQNIIIEDYKRYGIFSQMSMMYNEEVYSVIQVGTGYKAGSPNPDKVYCDILMSISPKIGKEKLIYKTDDASRIVGFDIKKDLVILYNKNSQVCSLNLETKEKKILMQLQKNSTPLLFQWSRGRLFVFEGRTDSVFLGSCCVE